MSKVAEIATGFRKLMTEGRFVEAGDHYWSQDVRSVEPADLSPAIPAVVEGIDAVREKLHLWFDKSSIEEFKIEGPFVTGEQFVVPMEMVIVNRENGEPVREIAVCTVTDGKVAEERYFY
jgi:SnoaL-like domain